MTDAIWLGWCEAHDCPLPATGMLLDGTVVCEAHAPTSEQEEQTLAALLRSAFQVGVRS